MNVAMGYLSQLKLKIRLLKERKSISEVYLWAGVLALAALFALIWDARQISPQTKEVAGNGHYDTFIPEGFVLVPIQVANYESLDLILGQHGVVDLFSSRENGLRSGERIAERIRILRSSQNPSQFAVLAPQAQAHHLLQAAGPFFVAIQNPKSDGTKFEQDGNMGQETHASNRSLQRRNRIRIEYHDTNRRSAIE